MTFQYRVGNQITHEQELDYAPTGEGKTSYTVLPRGGGLASVGVVDESGNLLCWAYQDVLILDALHYIKEHGKPKDWDPEDDLLPRL